MGAGAYFRLTGVVKRAGLGFLGATPRACCCAGIYDCPARSRSLIKDIGLKVTNKSKIEIRQARTAADSEQKYEYLFVSQHSSKPHVVRSFIFCQASCSF
jgi:hypothetical protein